MADSLHWADLGSTIKLTVKGPSSAPEVLEDGQTLHLGVDGRDVQLFGKVEVVAITAPKPQTWVLRLAKQGDWPRLLSSASRDARVHVDWDAWAEGSPTDAD